MKSTVEQTIHAIDKDQLITGGSLKKIYWRQAIATPAQKQVLCTSKHCSSGTLIWNPILYINVYCPTWMYMMVEPSVPVAPRRPASQLVNHKLPLSQTSWYLVSKLWGHQCLWEPTNPTRASVQLSNLPSLKRAHLGPSGSLREAHSWLGHPSTKLCCAPYGKSR